MNTSRALNRVPSEWVTFWGKIRTFCLVFEFDLTFVFWQCHLTVAGFLRPSFPWLWVLRTWSFFFIMGSSLPRHPMKSIGKMRASVKHRYLQHLAGYNYSRNYHKSLRQVHVANKLVQNRSSRLITCVISFLGQDSESVQDSAAEMPLPDVFLTSENMNLADPPIDYNHTPISFHLCIYIYRILPVGVPLEFDNAVWKFRIT